MCFFFFFFFLFVFGFSDFYQSFDVYSVDNSIGTNSTTFYNIDYYDNILYNVLPNVGADNYNIYFYQAREDFFLGTNPDQVQVFYNPLGFPNNILNFQSFITPAVLTYYDQYAVAALIPSQFDPNNYLNITSTSAIFIIYFMQDAPGSNYQAFNTNFQPATVILYDGGKFEFNCSNPTATIGAAQVCFEVANTTSMTSMVLCTLNATSANQKTIQPPTTDGNLQNGNSTNPQLSNTGLAVFQSTSSNFSPLDNTSNSDIYYWDLSNNYLLLV